LPQATTKPHYLTDLAANKAKPIQIAQGKLSPQKKADKNRLI
jgi:hypothetical protein